MSSPTESDDILGAKAGDAEAAARLLARHEGYVRKEAHRWPGDPDDLAQEARLAILESLAGLDVDLDRANLPRVFAAYARRSVLNAFQELQAHTSNGPTIPARTYKRAQASIQATGTIQAAEAHAVHIGGMGLDTFRAALVAMGYAQDLPMELAETHDVDTTSGERRQAWALLGTLPPELAEVVDLYYGLGTGEPLLRDLDVARALGMSRATANRRRLEAEDLLREGVL